MGMGVAMMKIIIAIIGIFAIVDCARADKYSTCKHIIQDLPSKCVNNTALNSVYSGRDDDLPTRILTNSLNSTTFDVKCRGKEKCRKNLRVSVNIMQTFSDKIIDVVWNMVSQCCHGCANMTVVRHFRRVTEENQNAADSPDMVYPILGKSDARELYGYHFIPIFTVPDAYYFTLRPFNTAIMKRMIYTCLDLWPMLVICILFSLISGFIIWIIETHNNKEDFPRSFRFGIFEGFWFCFVSMTTVGYGDKSPKSFLGRLFAIVWILVGVTIIAVYTAHLTTDLMNFRSIASPTMEGHKIGVLKGRFEDKTMVNQHGGVPHEIEYESTYKGIIEMIDQLRGNHIKGFLLNRDTFQWFSGWVRRRGDTATENKMIEYIMNTRKKYGTSDLVYGALVKESNDYEYFVRYFQNNRMQIESCYAAQSNNNILEIKLKDGLLEEKEVFYTFLYYSLGTLGTFVIIGVLYEIRTHYKAKSDQDNRWM